MPKQFGFLRVLGGGLVVPAALILLSQTVASRAFTIHERVLSTPPLETVPMQVGAWTAPGEQSLEQAVAEYLKPDSYILRDYWNASKSSSINLFVAYFKSLKNVYGPHSPRVCLPGTGWLIRSSTITSVVVPGRPEGIPVNEYVLDRDGNQILVLYWYQNNRNVWAEEYQEKLRLLSDMIRYRRSDVSLVRVITPLIGQSVETETKNSIDFTEALFPEVAGLLDAVR
jgi:EpsI family protein